MQDEIRWKDSPYVWPGTVYIAYPDQEAMDDGVCNFWDKIPESTYDNYVRVPICVCDSKHNRNYYLNYSLALTACVTALIVNRPEGMMMVV